MKTKHTNIQHLFFLSIILCLLFPLQKTYSQSDFFGTWQLEKIIIDDQVTSYEDFETYLAAYGEPILANQNIENNLEDTASNFETLLEYKEEECYLTAYSLQTTILDWESSSFFISGIHCFFDECPPNSLGEELKNLHNSFYYSESSEGEKEFNYSVTENNNIIQLEVTNSQGDKAYYYNVHLSTPDFEILSSSIYPNPVQDQLFIRLEDISTAVDIKIYDLQGRVIQSFQANQKETPLDVSNYHPGMYFIKLTNSSNQQKMMKFIKQ